MNSLVSEELRNSIQHDDANALVIVPKKKRKEPGETETIEKPHKRRKVNKLEQKLSKQEARRIEMLKEKKDKLKNREALIQSLQSTTIKPEQLQYLAASGDLGKTATRKQRVKRALVEEKLGLERSDPTVHIYKEKEINVDFDSRPEEDNTAAKFIEENEALLRASQTKKRKKKVIRTRGEQKVEKRGMFAPVEDDSDEEEREKLALELRKKAKKVDETSTPQKVIATAKPGFEVFDSSSDDDEGSNSESEEEKTMELNSTPSKPTAAPIPPPKTIEVTPLPEPTQFEVKSGGWSIPKFVAAPKPKPAAPEIDPLLAPNPVFPNRTVEPKALQRQAAEHAAKITAKPSTKPVAVGPQRPRNPAYYVLVNRTEEIEKQREDLPIIMEEQQIVEKIMENDVVIICGETGSGKTTQVPQFLYEAGYGDPKSRTPGQIGVTEPRRVAAVSTAQRVAVELNQKPPSLEEENNTSSNATAAAKDSRTQHVGYQIRYDAAVSDDTRIKFMTDGILLREIQNDFLLNRYSAIIIDEAHERTMNTDILLGLLCRIVPLRRALYEEQSKKSAAELEKISEDQRVASPLKFIIMSATLRVADFTSNRRMFAGQVPPVISIGSRQYPVTIHFNRKTAFENYVHEAFRKVVKIHTQLPEGGVLVFLTGQQEVESLCGMLRKHFQKRDAKIAKQRASVAAAKDSENADVDDLEGDLSDDDEDIDDQESIPMEERKLIAKKPQLLESPDDIDVPLLQYAKKDIEKHKRKMEKMEEKAKKAEDFKALVLPLYSMLPPKQQMKVFAATPSDTRLIVVATNIAETSLTIPGISYVVDAGRVKQKVYEKASGMSSFNIDWVSQASANQRAGRAGRTGPGHCYRLFSSAVFQGLSDFATPDILTIPIEGVVLQMKNMGISKIDSFPFPTSPDNYSLTIAHRTLSNIGSLEQDKSKEYLITALGKALVNYPVHPRFAKMLILGSQGNCIHYAIAIVAALAVGDPFLHATNKEASDLRQRKEWSNIINKTSDLLAWLSAIGAYEFADNKEEFADKIHLHTKTMKEIHLLRHQLTNMVAEHIGDESMTFQAKLDPPTREQKVMLRQVIAAGFVDQVAKRIPFTNEAGEAVSGKWKYITAITKQECFIHPSSFLLREHPEYIVYHELIETTKCYIKGITAISLGWMTSLGPWLCKGMDDILESPPPKYDAEKDRIRGLVQPVFVNADWLAPKTHVELSGLVAYKYFARYFLEGLVCPKFKPMVQHLNAKPELITKVFAQRKIAALLQPLLDKKVDTKQKLLEQWSKDSKFWLSSVALWIDDSMHPELMAMWPPVDSKTDSVSTKSSQSPSTNKTKTVLNR